MTAGPTAPTTSPVSWVNELLVLPAESSPAQARDFVRKYCLHQDLAYLVDDVCLVASELVTNAGIHARTRIRVRIEELPFCLKLTVYDESLDLPLKSLAGRVAADDEHGRGLWLVDACSADWGTDLVGTDGKSTWAIFAVRPRSSWVDSAPLPLPLPLPLRSVADARLDPV